MGELRRVKERWNADCHPQESATQIKSPRREQIGETRVPLGSLLYVISRRRHGANDPTSSGSLGTTKILEAPALAARSARRVIHESERVIFGSALSVPISHE